MRRACSIECQVGLVRSIGSGSSVPAGPARQASARRGRGAAISRRDRRRARARRAARRGDAARISEDETVMRLDLEERRPGRAASSRGEHRVERARVDARAASRRRAARARARAPGSFHVRKSRELVGADQEDRIVERERLERVDGARDGSSATSTPRERREGEPGEREPDPRRRRDVLVPGIARRPGRAAGRARSARCRARASATWPSCGGSNAPPRTPTVTAATRAPRRRSRPPRRCRTPAARSASSSSSPVGRSARRRGSRGRCGGRGTSAAPAAAAGSRGSRAARARRCSLGLGRRPGRARRAPA